MFVEKIKNGNNSWFLYIFTLLIIFAALILGNMPTVYCFPESINNMEAIAALAKANGGISFLLFPYITAFFALLLCIRFVHQKKYLDIITGRPQFSWKRMLTGALIWTILSIILLITTLYTNDNVIFQFKPLNFFILLIISLAMLPFQTAFEEILFRGYLMQGCILLFRSKWSALIFTSVVFGAMHLSNPEVKEFGLLLTLPQYIFMGLFLGYVALKDNGLELSIGIHAANNIMACAIYTSDASALPTHALFKDTEPVITSFDTIVLLVVAIIFIAIANRKYHFIKKNPFSL